jgi:hypothetical protein
MGLIELVIVLLLVGFLLWAVNTFAPPVIDARIITLINVVIILFVLIYLLRVFGVLSGLNSVRIRP